MNNKIMVITGTRKGIGRSLAESYLKQGLIVVGCSRGETDLQHERYRHFCLNVSDEKAVRQMIAVASKEFGQISSLINNAGIASMNHSFLTPLSTVEKIFGTNVFGTFLLCREVGKVMAKQRFGRIINFATVATPLHLEGESAYAASKAAIESYTKILAREYAEFHITVNAVGPTPIETDLIRNVPHEKIARLLQRQAIPRLGTVQDVQQVIDFFLDERSDFITGQVIYLGGISAC